MSFHDPAWYLKEFLDMQDAGLDAALPVYWGSRGSTTAGWRPPRS